MSIGKFVWHDLMTGDVAGAQSYYGAVAGWSTTPFEGSEQGYEMWVGPRGPIGGSIKMPAEMQGVPPHWLAYNHVADVDASVAQVTELGGSVQNRMEIPMVGRIAICQDPQGGWFALFQPAGDSPDQGGPAQPGEFSWAELGTTDQQGAWDFYSAILGWTVAMDMDMGPGGNYRIFKTPDMEGHGGLGGFYDKPPQVPVVAWLYYITVADIDAAVKTAVERGGKLLNGPMEVPGGDRVAQLMDAQGAAFGLHQSGPR